MPAKKRQSSEAAVREIRRQAKLEVHGALPALLGAEILEPDLVHQVGPENHRR